MKLFARSLPRRSATFSGAVFSGGAWAAALVLALAPFVGAALHAAGEPEHAGDPAPGAAPAAGAASAAKADAGHPAAPAKPDLAKGGQIATQVCAACHSIDGSRGSPAQPILQEIGRASCRERV